MTNTNNTIADELTNRTTAFATYADLLAACDTGYTPSLRKKDVAQLGLGARLEADGRRVFWR